MQDIQESEALIAFYNSKDPQDQNRWILIDKGSTKKMGTCGFHIWDRDKNEVEIGFELMEEYTRKGYMSEAVEALIDFARLEMKVATK